MIWLLVILGLAAYIAADAAFDVSKKISRFIRFGALPWIRGAWGAVVGRRPVRAAPTAPVNFNPGVKVSAPEQASPSTMRKTHIAPADVLAFLWKAKWLILFLSIFVVGVGAVRGCTPPFAKSRDTLRAELKEANENTIVAEFETKLANQAGALAEETRRDRDRASAVITQTEQELTDAVEASDFDRLHSAYERGTRGLWFDLEPADRTDPAPPGASPVRRPGADAA